MLDPCRAVSLEPEQRDHSQTANSDKGTRDLWPPEKCLERVTSLGHMFDAGDVSINERRFLAYDLGFGVN